MEWINTAFNGTSSGFTGDLTYFFSFKKRTCASSSFYDIMKPGKKIQRSFMALEAQRPGSMPLLTEGEAAPSKNCFRFVILGSAKVGKTSIVSRFLSNKYDDTYTPTIEDFHRKVYKIRGETYRLDILDCSGNDPFPAMRRLSLLTGK